MPSSDTETDTSIDNDMGDNERIDGLESRISKLTENVETLLSKFNNTNINSNVNSRPSTSNANVNSVNNVIPEAGVEAQGGQPVDAATLNNLVITKKKNPLNFDIDLMIYELETALTDDPNIKRKIPIRERKLITEYLRLAKYYAGGEPFTDEDLLATKEQLRLLFLVFQHNWSTALADKKEGGQQRLGIEVSATALQARKPYTRGRGRGRNYGRGYRTRGRGRGPATSSSTAGSAN